MWQKPGTMQTTSNRVHKIPAHPGADDDTDDDDDGDKEEEEEQSKVETQETTEETTETKYEPIKNLIEDPPSEAEEDG